MNERLTAFVGARISEFRRRMAEVHRTMRNTATSVVVNVEARTEKFNRRMDRLANTFRTFNTIGQNTMRGLGVSISSVAVPAVASLAGAIGSLGPMLGVVAGGAAGLGTAFGLAGAGAVAFGAVAVTNLQDVFKASEDIQKIQEKLSLEKDAKKRAKLLQEQAEIMANMNKEQVRAYQSMEKLRSVWQGITKPLEAKTVDIFAKSLDALSTILNYLKPTFTAATNAVNNLIDSFNQTLQTDDVRSFFDWMGKSVGPAMEALGKAGMNVMRGFMNLMVAFGPLSTDMQNGLLGMTEKFADWTSGIGKSKGFQEFIKYITTNGPKLLSIVGDISMGLVGMFAAFAPLSQDMMTGLQDLAARFREWGQTLSSNQQFQEFIGYIRDNAPNVIALIGEIARFVMNLATGLAPVGQAILGVLTPFLSWINSMMEANPLIGNIIAVVITLGGVLTALAPSIIAATTLFSGFGKVFGLLGSVFLKNGQEASKFSNFITTLWTKIKGVGTAIVGGLGKAFNFIKPLFTNFSGTIARLTPIIANLGSKVLPLLARGFAFLGGPVGIVIGILSLLIPVFIRLWNENENFRNGVMTAWNAIQSFLGTVISAISTFIQGVWSTLVAWWDDNNQTILSTAQAIWDTIYAVISTVIKTVWDVISQVVTRIQEFWNKHGETILSVAEKVWNNISSVISVVTSVIWSVIKGVLGFIKGLFETVWPIISGVVQVAWSIISSAVQVGIDLVFGIIDTVMNLLKGDWEGAWDAISKTASNIWDTIVSTFENIDLWQIGKDIINGLVNGIGSMAGAVWDTVTSIGSNIKDGFTSFFDIHSPSKLMNKDVGRRIPAGVIKGMDSMRRGVASAAQRVSQAAYVEPQRTSFAYDTSMSSSGFDAIRSEFGDNEFKKETYERTENYDGMFRGANFHVRQESDIQGIARELHNLQKAERRKVR